MKSSIILCNSINKLTYYLQRLNTPTTSDTFITPYYMSAILQLSTHTRLTALCPGAGGVAVVERRSLASELSLSYTRPAADG